MKRSSVLGKISRRVRNAVFPRGIILCYHRVADRAFDPFDVAVPPRLFGEQMETLRRLAHPLPLGALLDFAAAGRIPRRAVAVTFDDGYADVLHNAKPLLERFEIPATAFLISGAIGQGGEFWWDELARIILAGPPLPPRLSLRIGSGELLWEADPAAETPRLSRFSDSAASGTPARLLQQLHPLVGALPDSERIEMMQTLRQWAGARTREDIHDVLTAHEVNELAAGGLVEIGGHTASHPMLPKIPTDQLHQEITASRGVLSEMAGVSISHFAYPYGWFDESAVDAVQLAGYRSACTLIPTPVRPSPDPYRLPRLWAQGWDGTTFANVLSIWFSAH